MGKTSIYVPIDGLDIFRALKQQPGGYEDTSERYVLDISRDALWVLDYLCIRPDVLVERIAAMGVSLGGMACWLLAAADERIYAAVPAIGRWGLYKFIGEVLWYRKSVLVGLWWHSLPLLTLANPGGS